MICAYMLVVVLEQEQIQLQAHPACCSTQAPIVATSVRLLAENSVADTTAKLAEVSVMVEIRNCRHPEKVTKCLSTYS